MARLLSKPLCTTPATIILREEGKHYLEFGLRNLDRGDSFIRLSGVKIHEPWIEAAWENDFAHEPEAAMGHQLQIEGFGGHHQVVEGGKTAPLGEGKLMILRPSVLVALEKGVFLEKDNTILHWTLVQAPRFGRRQSWELHYRSNC